MNNTLHTPSPWKSSDRCGNFGDYNRHENNAPNGQVSRHSYSVVDEEGFVVAHCTNPLVTMSSERSEANARLISAAPDLLSALERLLKISQEELDQSATHDGLVNCEALANARVAIAKAKGEA
jgi:hypothetical protein